MRQLLVATTNPGKLREIRTLMIGVPVALVSLTDLSRRSSSGAKADIAPIDEPEETGATFEENARLKALYYAERSGLPAVAEDSGLVIDALGGEPGVRSARFLRADASYPERFAEIFARLQQRPGEPRTARFVAALAYVDNGKVIYETTGVVEGQIADAPRGTDGFGYDPIFYYPAYERTLAEVSELEKVAIAHRGVAFRAFAQWIITGGS